MVGMEAMEEILGQVVVEVEQLQPQHKQVVVELEETDMYF
jgi:hypothetical protein